MLLVYVIFFFVFVVQFTLIVTILYIITALFVKRFSVFIASVIQSSILTPLVLPGMFYAGGGMGGIAFPLLSVLGAPIYNKYEKGWAGPFTKDISNEISIVITIVTWVILVIICAIFNERRRLKIKEHNEI